MSEPLRCPIHDAPDAGPCDRWNCPEDCLEWLDEMERRIKDMEIHGNYVRTSVVDGVFSRQTFRNHQPIDEPVAWRPVKTEEK